MFNYKSGGGGNGSHKGKALACTRRIAVTPGETELDLNRLYGDVYRPNRVTEAPAAG